MRNRGVWSVVVAVCVVALGAVACGDDDDGNGASDGPAPEGSLRVPQDYDTIQEAVDAAEPGDLVYIDTGTYKETVTITTENLVLRGADRNETIIDGEFERENCVFVVETNGVAVENLTTQNCTKNGVFFTGVDGYRASYVSAIRNGDYGIYAFDSVNGQFDHSYGGGSPDAGFYIGQCNPCNAVITDVEAEWNGLGYSGTNSSGNLIIANSSWHDNRSGIVPNSGTGEELHPQRDNVIVGNTVYDNNNADTASISIAELAIGTGILVAGGNDNVIDRNLVEDHDLAGIAVIPLPETAIDPENPDAIDFDARGNRVIGNVVQASDPADRDEREFAADLPQWDLVVVTGLTAETDGGGNCFSENDAATSGPSDLQSLLPCDGPPSTAFAAPIADFARALLAEKPGTQDYQDVDLPERTFENMPDADSAPPVPATQDNVPMTIDVAAITTPTSTGS